MEFIYFHASKSEMAHLISEAMHKCSLCGKTGYCFQLDSAICHEFSNSEQSGKIGCYGCLRKGKLEFAHDTEFGYLDENGLHRCDFFEDEEQRVFVVDDISVHTNVQIPYYSESDFINPPEAALIELRRTPDFTTWQGSIWLVHCNDFMVYLGSWEPEDFRQNSPNGNGRTLFLSMTHPENHKLADDYELWTQEKSDLKRWCITYYAFKCRHCRFLKGYYDYT